MEYININLSDKKYEKTKKHVVINLGIFVTAVLFFLVSFVNIILILTINSQNEEKGHILNKKIEILTNKVKEEEVLKIKYEENLKKTNIDETKKKSMEEVINNIDTNTATLVFNKIEKRLPKDVVVTKFAMYDTKINITVVSKSEPKVMEFVNSLQKDFSDVFILENRDNNVNIEINI